MALTADEKQYLKSVESGKTPEQLKVLLSQYRRNKTTSTPAQTTPTTQPQQPANENLSKLQQDPTGLNSLLVPKTEKQYIRPSATEDVVSGVGKALWELPGQAWNAGAGAVGAVTNAVSNPIQTTYNIGSGLAKAGQSVVEGAVNTFNNPGKALADIGGGAVSGAAGAVGNVAKFAGDTAGTVLDIASDIGPDITGIKKKQQELRDKVNKGEQLSPEETQFMNSRVGDIARIAGGTGQIIGKTIEKGVTELGKETNTYNTESGWGQFGGILSDTALTYILTQGAAKAGILKNLPKDTKQIFNLGSKLLTKVENPSTARLVAEKTLNFLGSKVKSYAPALRSGVITTGLADAVTKGETNAASLAIGFLTDRFIQNRGAKLQNKALKGYQVAQPFKAPAELGVGKVAEEQFQKFTEDGLKRGWVAKTKDDFVQLLSDKKNIHLDAAKQELEKNATKKIKIAPIAQSFEDVAKKMEASGRKDVATNIRNFYQDRIAPLAQFQKKGTKLSEYVTAEQLDTIKKGFNETLSAFKNGQTVDINNASNAIFAMNGKTIVDDALNAALGGTFTKNNKAAATAYYLLDLAEMNQSQAAAAERSLLDTATNRVTAAGVPLDAKQISAAKKSAATLAAGKMKGAGTTAFLKNKAGEKLLSTKVQGLVAGAKGALGKYFGL